MDHNRRIGQLRRRITRAGLHGLLVTHLPDVRYLCGFTGSSAALAITRRAARLFTDGRYTDSGSRRSQRREGTDCRRAHRRQMPSSGSLHSRAWSSPDSIRRAPGCRFGAPARRAAGASAPHFFAPLAAPLVEPLRWVKDEDELRILSEAALIGCQLFEHSYVHPARPRGI